MDTTSTHQLLTAEAPRAQHRALPREAHRIRRILVCLDRSPLSAVCLPYAVSLSRTFGSAITLLHVMQAPHESNGRPATNVLGWEISRQEAITYMEEMRDEAAQTSGQEVDTRLEQGHPAERIMALARQINADLTVIGSHGEGGLTAWSLGSTAQQLLSVSRGSVLVARPGSPAASPALPRRILVPLDGSLRTESVLPTAVRIAKDHGAELVLVNVVQEPHPTALLRAAEDMELARELASRIERRANEYLAQLRDQLAREVPSVRSLVLRHSDERQALLEISQKESIDLVVLSAHGSTCNPAHPFGSVAGHLLTHSRVTLLVLQDLPEPAGEGDAVDDTQAPPLRASYPPEGS